jgi:hypothetical protein
LNQVNPIEETGAVSAEQSEQKQEQAAVEAEKETPAARRAVAHPWEAELDSYPLRPPEEDPGWAVKTVKIWLWTAIALGVFILALLVLGYFYD